MEGAEFRNICTPGAGQKGPLPGGGKPGERWPVAAELIEASPTGIMLTDLDAAIVAVNPAFSRITGFAAEEVVGKTPRMLASGRHRPGFYRRMWRTLAATGWWQGEVWNRRKNDQVKLAYVAYEPANVRSEVNLTEEELRNYFTSNRGAFTPVTWAGAAGPTTGRSPGSRSARSCARCSTTTSCSTGCRPTRTIAR